MLVALVQARMGSHRRPGKVLADIAGRPMLWHVLHRLRNARRPDRIVVATSTAQQDDAIVRLCEEARIETFRGSEHDVLDRYYRAALACKADGVVRITADCPLVDPGVVDQVVSVFQAAKYDYVSNTIHRTFPVGLDVEVFSFAALARAWKEAEAEDQREHVTPYFRAAGDFVLSNVEWTGGPGLQDLRWTVDYEADLAYVREIYRELYDGGAVFLFSDILNLIRRRPDLFRTGRPAGSEVQAI
ncbi:MAG: hypothetical protein A3G34_14095 [Candidatus Lindowbacteria bacterium RIFCSPLOWO2_12_FULL_62_27]|nr:MAG: hypothetical protein A3I06_00520 [Candidatus Lindowbacteria bacterium RIFCSPLOWO2_02_FULL_62_12]OGH62801.1 MAG: hypothetical protein A3G34_14095 [Candidatus Lindowbacteria bacterium RIFCSPLOWO2_12_FULL_62_27]